MIWRLEYENAHGDVARLDIQRGAATPVEIIEGTENPFLLSYELEDKSKKGFIMSSFADISIYETATFNIDDLKTLDETALSVKWYINSVLEWTGFVVPDFFSRTIGEPAIVNLAASDRLSSLEDATLDGLSEYVKLKDLAIACLAKTGLSLPLITTVDFKADTTNIMDAFAISGRLEDGKGKKISCFDVLRSILVLTNSTIRQRKGQWRIYNKIQHEALTPSLNFNEVYQGAKRTIQPVFSSVGAFQEFGGGKRYPSNNDFQLATGWTAKNGFVFARENREILRYTVTGSLPVRTYTPVFGDVTDNFLLANNNNIKIDQPTDITGSPYLESTIWPVPYDKGLVKINIDLNAIAPVATFINPSDKLSGAIVYYAVIAESPTETLILTKDGLFVPIANGKNNFQKLEFISSDDEEKGAAISRGVNLTALLDIGSSEYYNISVRIYGSGSTITTFIDSISFSFSLEQDNGKGILYRTDQLGNFSKKNDPATTIFGDYISSGLNGYFYPYPKDDTSILRMYADDDYPSFEWTTATDPAAGELPILQHVTRQISRMFGVAHNVLSAVIDAKTFDPLAIVTNCAGEKYVIVYSVFDFLRSTVEVELQQIAYGSLQRRDFIFSYFGGGDGDGISSIGSVSGGGSSGGGGGGSFLDKYFSFDEENNALIANVNLASEKEIAAWTDGGNLPPTIWDAMPFATSAKVGGIKAASTFQNGIKINSLGFLEIDPAYAGGGVSSWNDLTNRPSWLTPTTKAAFEAAHGHTWGQITSKPTTFPPTAHNHTIGNITGLQGALDGYARKGQNETITGSWNFSNNIGINQPNPTEKLHVVGNGLFTGNVTANNGIFTGLMKVTHPAPRYEFHQSDVQNAARWVLDGVYMQMQVIEYGTSAFFKTPFSIDINAPSGAFKVESNGGVTVSGNLTANNGTFTGLKIGANDVATEIWIQNTGTAYNALRLGGHLASLYPRRNVLEGISARWDFNGGINVKVRTVYQDSSGATVGDIGLESNYGGKTSLVINANYDSNILGFQTSAGYSSRTTMDELGNWNMAKNITAQGEVTAYSSSDVRLKQNIKPIENALDIISKLNPVSFNWNDKAIELNSAKDSDRVNYGVIAQEIERVLPGLVHNTNGYKSVDYQQLIMILAKAIQELNLKIK